MSRCTPLDLDLAAIEARAVAVAHHRTGPGRCACGYDAYKVGGFFPDYHAMLMSHLALAPRTVTPANTDDVLALVAALRDARGEVASLKVQQAELAVDVGDLTRDEQAYHDRALTAEAQVAAVLALPGREWSEDHADSPESRAARAYNSALLAARRAITGGTDEG